MENKLSSEAVLQYTPKEEIPKILESLKATFKSERTYGLEFRKTQLRKLYSMLQDNKNELVTAMTSDHKSPKEAEDEVVNTMKEVKYHLDHIDSWMKPVPVSSALVYKMDSCYVRRDPLGVVLIFGAWNYPLILSIKPFVGAVAGGNCVVLKPSELAPHTAAALEKLFPRYLPADCYRIVNGGPEECQALLDEKLRWDYVFYTGNGVIGKSIYQQVAKHLTPVTLELGGKSPCYVSDCSDVNVTASRICAAKFMNAGQTCVAPDYVLCSSKTADALIESCKKCIEEAYGGDIANAPNYGRIVNDKHMKRLDELLKSSSGRIVHGGKLNMETRFVEPTILNNITGKDSLMKQEIFGPLLPIVHVNNHLEAIDFVQSRAKPLSLYIFSNDDKEVESMINRTSSGGVCVNDAFVHIRVPTLPFGGVGESGFGAYHGKKTFDTFTHEKSVMWRSQWGEMVNNWFRYPPMYPAKWNWLNRLFFRGLSKGMEDTGKPIAAEGKTTAAPTN